jgi:hypothetical protein
MDAGSMTREMKAPPNYPDPYTATFAGFICCMTGVHWWTFISFQFDHHKCRSCGRHTRQIDKDQWVESDE